MVYRHPPCPGSLPALLCFADLSAWELGLPPWYSPTWLPEDGVGIPIVCDFPARHPNGSPVTSEHGHASTVRRRSPAPRGTDRRRTSSRAGDIQRRPSPPLWDGARRGQRDGSDHPGRRHVRPRRPRLHRAQGGDGWCVTSACAAGGGDTQLETITEVFACFVGDVLTCQNGHSDAKDRFPFCRWCVFFLAEG